MCYWDEGREVTEKGREVTGDRREGRDVSGEGKEGREVAGEGRGER